MKLTRAENCGLPDARSPALTTLRASPKPSLTVQTNQWFSCGPTSVGDNSVSLLQRCSLWHVPSARGEADCQRTDLSTLASASEHRDSGLARAESEVDTLLSKVNDGLGRNIQPLKNGLGTSGVYSMRDGLRNVVAIFKPVDEEPSVQGSSGDFPEDRRRPRGHSYDVSRTQEAFEPRRVPHDRRRLAPRIGLYAGELCLREAAAYLLDGEGVHGVPATAMAQVPNKLLPQNQQKGSEALRVGSLQRFVQNNGVSSNISCSKFSVVEVQKIALLDLRILNSDRNEANILFRRLADDRVTLVPIDHALSMPDKLEVYQADLCWMEWPQSREPLCPQLADYLARIDPEKDAAMLRVSLGIREECLVNLRIATVFLKKAVARGLSLAKVASLMYRAKEFSKSPLEKLVEKTRLTFDFLLRKADLIPRGVDLSPRTQLRDAKKGLYTPQKFHRFANTSVAPSPFEPRDELPPLSRTFLAPLRTHSAIAPSFPLNIFPPSLPLALTATVSTPTGHSLVRLPDQSVFSPLIKPFSAFREVPFNDFQMPGRDLTDSKSACSNSGDMSVLPEGPVAVSQLPLLQAISCTPHPAKHRKGGQRQTVMPEHSVRTTPTRSATQERRVCSAEEVQEKLCFLSNVKTSQQSRLQLFFECFEMNVDRFLEEKARRSPRKYTMHVG